MCYLQTTELRGEVYSPFVEMAFPLSVLHINFSLAADESDDEFALFVHHFFTAAARDGDALGVDEVLSQGRGMDARVLCVLCAFLGVNVIGEQE